MIVPTSIHSLFQLHLMKVSLFKPKEFTLTTADKYTMKRRSSGMCYGHSKQIAENFHRKAFIADILKSSSSYPCWKLICETAVINLLHLISVAGIEKLDWCLGEAW